MNRKVPILITTYRNSLHHLLNIAVLVDKMDKTNITEQKKKEPIKNKEHKKNRTKQQTKNRTK